VIIENGKEVGWLGDPNGKKIPIKWEDFKDEKEDWEGYYSSGNESIALNQNLKNKNSIYWNTLAHEMQHAIDFNSNNIDIKAVKRMNSLSTDSISNLSLNEVEKIFENGYMEKVKTEIHAHDRGYTMDISSSADDAILNAQDGVYTYKEVDFIINKRPYEALYEEEINNKLVEIYGEESNYKADVWVDKSGNIQIDIKKPLVARIKEKLDI
jgi:hypothetical protein